MKNLLNSIKNIFLSFIYSLVIFVYVQVEYGCNQKVAFIVVVFNLLVFGVSVHTRLNLYYNYYILNKISDAIGAIFFRFVLVHYIISFYQVMGNLDNLKFDLVFRAVLVSVLIFIIFILIASSSVIGIKRKLYIKLFIDELERLIIMLLIISFLSACLGFIFAKFILVVVLGLISVFIGFVRALVLTINKI